MIDEEDAAQPPDTARGICAIVVTFHADGGFPERLERLAGQVGRTLVIDNGSTDASAAMLAGLARGALVEVLFNGVNLGIARALNIGVRRALALGYSWALLSDQDTEVDLDMAERLMATRASCGRADRLAVVGSRFRDTHGHEVEPIRLGARGELWEEVESVVTSGSLLSLRAYGAIGPFRDEFFIDHVDTEYCLRARAAGYHVIRTVQPLMAHTVGAPSAHRLLGMTRWTTNHSADRRYYMARNNTVLLREYGTRKGGSWQLKSVTRCLRLCKRIAFFEPDKLDKITAVAQGWWHGVRGKMGPRPA